MTKIAAEFNRRYNLNVSDNAFVQVDRPNMANELIGKPRGNFLQAVKRFFFKPSSLIATIVFLVIVVMAIVIPLTSSYGSIARVYAQNDDTVGELTTFANLPSAGVWKVETSGTDDLIATFRARGFVEGVDWKYVGNQSEGFSPIITYDIWKFAKLVDPTLPTGSILGTNALAQDVWTRTWDGIGRSLGLGFGVSAITLLLGTIVGSVSGLYYGTWFDIALMRFVDTFSNIPSLVLIVVITSVFPQSFIGLLFLLFMLYWANPLIAARTNILRFSNTDYIKVAKTNGVSLFGRIFKHALPNYIGVMAYVFFTSVAATIVGQAYISVLGIPFDPVTPYLGNTVNELRSAIGGVTENIGYVLFPCMMLIGIALSMRYIGVGINDAVDPKFSLR